MNNMLVAHTHDIDFPEDLKIVIGTYISIRGKRIVDVLREGRNFDAS